MRVAVGSIFRDSASYIARYVGQFHALVDATSEHFFDPILVEGDSSDMTAELLRIHFDGCVHTRNHGGRAYGSVDDPQRWRQISFACDGVLEQVNPEHDALIYVESDLVWEPETMLALLAHLDRVDAVAPMCFALADGHFYDSYGHIARGINFGPWFPYHPMLTEQRRGGLYELDSAGSCIVMKGEVARKARFDPAEKGIVGFCESLRAYGYKLWLDPHLAVKHP